MYSKDLFYCSDINSFKVVEIFQFICLCQSCVAWFMSLLCPYVYYYLWLSCVVIVLYVQLVLVWFTHYSRCSCPSQPCLVLSCPALLKLKTVNLSWSSSSCPFAGMQLGFWPKGIMSLTASTVPGATPLAWYSWLSACLLRDIGLHSPQHGGVGITFPIATPRGRSSKFPWRGTSQVTCVTIVPRIGNETLRPLGCVPCFGRKLQTKKWMMCPPGVPYISVTLVVTSWAVAGQQVVFLYFMLQARVTLTTFPIATPRGRSVSFPIRGTMVTYVTWDETPPWDAKLWMEAVFGFLLSK